MSLLRDLSHQLSHENSHETRGENVSVSSHTYKGVRQDKFFSPERHRLCLRSFTHDGYADDARAVGSPARKTLFFIARPKHLADLSHLADSAGALRDSKVPNRPGAVLLASEDLMHR